jgi:cytochrome c5
VSDAAPRDILQEATDLVTGTDWASAFWWCRGAALLSRQALELSLAQFWEAHEPGMERASMRAQFLTLRDVGLDVAVIASGSIVYDQLSRACHYHPYELQPTRSEVEDWIGMVARFHDALVEHARRQTPR